MGMRITPEILVYVTSKHPGCFISFFCLTNEHQARQHVVGKHFNAASTLNSSSRLPTTVYRLPNFFPLHATTFAALVSSQHIMHRTSTAQLVADCLRNRAAAQKQLYDTYAPQMMGVCYRYTRQADEASDVLQEGFIKVFTNLQQWKGDGDLGAWIRRIMVNTALNWLRDRRHMQWVQEEAIAEDFASDTVHTPVDQLEARQLADLIRQLPAGYQTIFNLHAIEGYSHVEIAQLLGISEGTSRSQYLRARRQLAGMINDCITAKKQSYASR